MSLGGFGRVWVGLGGFGWVCVSVCGFGWVLNLVNLVVLQRCYSQDK